MNDLSKYIQEKLVIDKNVQARPSSFNTEKIDDVLKELLTGYSVHYEEIETTKNSKKEKGLQVTINFQNSDSVSNNTILAKKICSRIVTVTDYEWTLRTAENKLISITLVYK